MFSICENMVLQNPPIFYTHPVETTAFLAVMKPALAV